MLGAAETTKPVTGNCYSVKLFRSHAYPTRIAYTVQDPHQNLHEIHRV